MDGKCQQVRIGDLPVAVESGAVDCRWIEDADVVGPTLVSVAERRLVQHCYSLGRRDRVAVRRVAEDPDEAVLCERRRRPTCLAVLAEPCLSRLVPYMLAV